MSTAAEPAWKVVGASVRGSGHEARNTPCQDAHAIVSPRPGWVVLAVADGAGSAVHSEVGADLAVRQVTGELRAALSEKALADDEIIALLTRVIARAREAVVAEAAKRQCEAHELASTLVVAVASPSSVVTAHIGDGAVILAKEDGTVVTLSGPEPTEHPNETTFLTSANGLDSLRIGRAETAPARLAVISDGLQNLVLNYPTWDPYLPFFEPLFKFLSESGDELDATKQVESLLRGKRVRSKSDDDVTLVVAGRLDISPARYAVEGTQVHTPAS